MSEQPISVALCTYNGERHLRDQLESLRAQTRPPAELVVCDDGSRDASVDVVKAFAKRAPFAVRVSVNPERLGPARNFEQAIGLCQGEIIALSDQDDVWLPDKLARLAARLSGPQPAQFVFCDAVVTDETLRPLGYTHWQRLGFHKAERRLAADGNLFRVLLKHYVVAGACTAFRADLRETLLPIPGNWLYDAWIALVASGTRSSAIVNAPLQRYRQHRANVIGGQREDRLVEVAHGLRVNRRDYYREEIPRWHGLQQRLQACGGAPECREEVAKKLGHLERRAGLPSSRLLRLRGIVTEVGNGNYRRYARNWGSVALDLLLK